MLALLQFGVHDEVWCEGVCGSLIAEAASGRCIKGARMCKMR